VSLFNVAKGGYFLKKSIRRKSAEKPSINSKMPFFELKDLVL
jgi:hypothetical protein